MKTYIAAGAAIGLLVGAILARVMAPAPPPLPEGPTPQQRINEAFDALGLQRTPLPPNVLPPERKNP